MSNKREFWEDIPGFDGWYEVSDMGRVRSWRVRAKTDCQANHPRILKGEKNKRGYVKVKLTHPVIGKISLAVHRIVLCTFVGPCPKNHVCNHINADPGDNRIRNLEWVTPAENVRHASALGRIRGFNEGLTTLRSHDIVNIRALRKKGWTLRAIAERYGVSDTSICRIVKRQSFRHVQ